MFDATEAINDIIDDINADYYESCYDAIYEELTERVESGEMTIEEAEMVNEAAAEKYLSEAEDVDKALETDDDDDKKKKESDKNIKKKINKKKVAAGLGLAAGAYAAGSMGLAYYADAKTSQSNNAVYSMYNRKKDMKENYKNANKLGKKMIMDYEKDKRKKKIERRKNC